MALRASRRGPECGCFLISDRSCSASRTYRELISLLARSLGPPGTPPTASTRCGGVDIRGQVTLAPEQAARMTVSLAVGDNLLPTPLRLRSDRAEDILQTLPWRSVRTFTGGPNPGERLYICVRYT